MPHFFISYAKKDTRELAIALNEGLNALPNVSAWVDPSLKAGRSWETQIQREINKCDYFIVLYSPDLNRHLVDETVSESYVLTEISYAKYTLKKPIIPVMAQSTTAPLSLTTAHYIDYSGKGMSLNDLLAAICAEAGIELEEEDALETAILPAMPAAKPAPVQRSGKGAKTLSALPAPFDWCEVPAGKVSLKAGGYVSEGLKSFELPSFRIAKYPISNAQFAKFVEAGGYGNKAWWTTAAWAQKEKGKWTGPLFAQNRLFNGAEQPVVGVSWYEAVAYCRWLSELSGEKVMLPTEPQWQRAAQGDDGRAYPWGDVWDGEKCRNSVSPVSSESTASVTRYDKPGLSPYELVDMAGNVWEWVLTSYKTGKDDIVGEEARGLRGGAWADDNISEFRVDERGNGSPEFRNLFIGFRIALN